MCSHQAVQCVHIRLYNVFTSDCTMCSHQTVQCVHIFLRPFINYTIFFLQLCLSFQSSSTNPFSPISPLLPSTQVSVGLPRFLLPGGRHFIIFEHVHTIE